MLGGSLLHTARRIDLRRASTQNKVWYPSRYYESSKSGLREQRCRVFLYRKRLSRVATLPRRDIGGTPELTVPIPLWPGLIPPSDGLERRYLRLVHAPNRRASKSAKRNAHS